MFKSSIIIMIFLVDKIEMINHDISPTCDMNQCSGYYKLIPHQIKKPNIEVTKTQVKIVETSPKQEILYVKRRWLTIYCYDGSSIDPNTGCYESIDSVNPSCDELREWDHRGKCPTGWECRPDGDCKGSDATSKCYDPYTMTTNVGPKSLKWEGARYFLFPMHTCVSSWECNTFSAEVDIFAKTSTEGKLYWVFYDKDNMEHELNGSLYEEGHTGRYKEKLCLKTQVKEPMISIEDAVCYSEDVNNIKCMIISDKSNNGLVFDVSKSGEGVLRNMKLEIIGSLMVPENGRLVDLNADKSNKYKYPPSTIMDRQRSVNIETAHELAISATILQMQSLYNIMSLAQEVDEIYNAIIHIVKSQSIDDPSLISRILRKPNFAAKWSNEEIFEKCGCINTPPQENSNCKDGKMYSYGSYVESTDGSKCYYIPKESVQNLTLINATSLNVDSIKYLPPQTASSDSASWDMLNDYRNKLNEGDRTSHSYDNLKDKISKLEDKMGLGTLNKIFLYSSCAAAWFSFLVLVLRGKNN